MANVTYWVVCALGGWYSRELCDACGLDRKWSLLAATTVWFAASIVLLEVT